MGEGLGNVLAASRATPRLFWLVQESGKGPLPTPVGCWRFLRQLDFEGLAGACWAVARSECKAVLRVGCVE